MKNDMETSYVRNVDPARQMRAGSALLVTLLVVSLLLVTVLTFVVVVRQELRKVINHQELLQARAHARLGLNMAVAKLQESAGPDTRVTAPVFPDEDARPNSLLIGQALDAQPFIPGNSLQLNPRYAQPTGYFISHEPGESFNPRSYWPFLGGTGVEPGNVLLIGPGTVSARDENGDGIPDGYVAAPLRPIHAAATPGMGHFAYHIRDNGMQAQINLVDSFRLENNGRMDLREQAVTAQRVASEFLLPNFDPDNVIHQDFLGRVLETSQLNLTPFVGEQGANDYYHGITLQSLGLPVNVQTGGFRRDLTAVMREMEDNLRNGTQNEDQLQRLFDFQQARMQRWRQQTLALEGTSRPAGMPLHRWNGLNALTLREDQNRNAPNDYSSFNASRLDINPPFREKIFPPISDMSIRHDPGGASWRQLLSHATKRDRLLDASGSFLQVNMPREATAEVNPVVARLSYNFYMTLDWPILRIHYVPVVVLWNPYNVPIGPAQGDAWHFVKKFEADRMRGLTYRFLVQHNDWNNGEPLWTPSRDSHLMFNSHSPSYNY